MSEPQKLRCVATCGCGAVVERIAEGFEPETETRAWDAHALAEHNWVRWRGRHWCEQCFEQRCEELVQLREFKAKVEGLARGARKRIGAANALGLRDRLMEQLTDLAPKEEWDEVAGAAT